MEMPSRQVTRRLHDEHQATLALWARVEASLAARRSDPALMRQAATSLSEEVDRHFAFEETELFPRLGAAGEGDIAALLLEEHGAIRATAAEFMRLARTDPSNENLRRLGLELTERLVAHVQKEEMSLLPALEDLLDDDADHELAAAYAAL